MNSDYTYIKSFSNVFMPELLSEWVDSLDWLEETNARKELFMSPGGGVSYTYGKGRGIRTYTSIEMDEFVSLMMIKVNKALELMGPMNGCFLNLYEDDHKALGWHADDFREMDHTKAVAVVSFGEPREIWLRPNGVTGATPPERRLLLDNGSLFIMHPGFQHTHEHRIPKGDRKMNPRVSLTFRAFLGNECHESHEPNEATKEAMMELRDGKNSKSFNTIEELMKDLNSDTI